MMAKAAEKGQTGNVRARAGMMANGPCRKRRKRGYRQLVRRPRPEQVCGSRTDRMEQRRPGGLRRKRPAGPRGAFSAAGAGVRTAGSIEGPVMNCRIGRASGVFG